MQGIVDLAHWLVLIVVLSGVIREGTGWRYLFNANLGISVAISLLGITQSLGVNDMPVYGYLQADARVGITLGNPAFVGAYLMVNVLVGLGLFIQSFEQRREVSRASPTPRRRRRRRVRNQDSDASVLPWRLFWAVAVALDLWVITLTGTRGAAIGLVVGLATLAVGYLVFGRRKAVKIGLVGIVALIILTVLSGILFANNSVVMRLASSNILLQRITDVSPDQVPFRARVLTLSVGAKAFAERPILGWGPENYLIAFGRYYTKGSETPETLDQAHNKPVEELVTKGAIGLISFGSIWVYAYIVFIRRLRTIDDSQRMFALGLLAALTAYFVQNLFLFDTPATFLQFALLMAFAVYLDSGAQVSSADVESGRLSQKGAKSASRMPHENTESAHTFLTSPLGDWKKVLRGINAIRLRWLGLYFAIIVMVLSLFLNMRFMQAATTVLIVTKGVRGVGQAIETLDKSINAFPPLANYPRLILFNNASTIWPGLTEPERAKLLSSVETEASRAIEQEPQNWRIFLSLAKMYQEIADQSVGFQGLDSARHYVDGAMRLAPERLEINPILLRIEKMERKLAEQQ